MSELDLVRENLRAGDESIRDAQAGLTEGDVEGLNITRLKERIAEAAGQIAGVCDPALRVNASAERPHRAAQRATDAYRAAVDDATGRDAISLVENANT